MLQLGHQLAHQIDGFPSSRLEEASKSLLSLYPQLLQPIIQHSQEHIMAEIPPRHDKPVERAGGVLEDCFPLFIANDGYTKQEGDGETTSTCFCGGVQYAFPVRGEGISTCFTCHCTDCRKVSSSMFATNFTVMATHLRLVRGKDLLRSYGQSATIGSPRNDHTMTNTWCNNCGTLMHRASSGHPDKVYMRLGQVDDFSLHETAFKPKVELFVKDRASWLHPVEGAVQRAKM